MSLKKTVQIDIYTRDEEKGYKVTYLPDQTLLMETINQGEVGQYDYAHEWLKIQIGDSDVYLVRKSELMAAVKAAAE